MDESDQFRMEWIVDGCGGMFNTYSEEFTSPGYPGYYPINITCEWTITTKLGSSIRITIKDFWMEDSTGSCVFDFLAVCISNKCV